MGARIENAVSTSPGLLPFNNGSIPLAIKAGEECIRSTSIGKDRIGLLINTGIYRDEHIGEPAIASLIQKGMDLNPLFNDKGATFSFDLYNGICGPLNALEIISHQIDGRRIEYGLIVTSDRNPYIKYSEGYEFIPKGGAILLGPSLNGQGFIQFRSYTYPEFRNYFNSGLRFKDWGKSKNGKNKRHILTIEKDREYLDSCIECGKNGIRRFLDSIDLHETEVDLIISTNYPPGLVEGIKRSGILPEEIFSNQPAGIERVHTASIPMVLEKAIKDKKFQSAKNVIFLSIGAGITVQLAHYRGDKEVCYN